MPSKHLGGSAEADTMLETLEPEHPQGDGRQEQPQPEPAPASVAAAPPAAAPWLALA